MFSLPSQKKIQQYFKQVLRVKHDSLHSSWYCCRPYCHVFIFVGRMMFANTCCSTQIKCVVPAERVQVLYSNNNKKKKKLHTGFIMLYCTTLYYAYYNYITSNKRCGCISLIKLDSNVKCVVIKFN